MIEIGQAIKTIRIKRGLTQDELAQRCGLSLSYISLVERNKRDMPMSTLELIADGLEISSILLMFLAEGTEVIHNINPELAEKLAYEALRG